MHKTPIPFIAAMDYPLTAAWVQALQKAMPDETIVPFHQMDAASQAVCSMAIVANPDPADLRSLPKLRWVHSVWAGVERLVADLGQTQLQIARLVDPQLAQTMAEAVLAWTLYLHRDMPAYAQQQRQRIWKPLEYVRAEDKTVGILGLGTLGEAAAQRLLAADFKVCGWSRSAKAIAGIDAFSGRDGLKPMLAKADILVCLLPLTAATRGLLDAEQLACLPNGAGVVNFARGPIMDDAALRAELDSGRLNHAVLDVFEVEPLPVAQWQWQHPRVTVLPHCSAPTDRRTASAIVAANIRRYRETGMLPDCIDLSRGY
jgi:glyoxylate/hydroxypyruvate reductase A